MKKQIVKLLSLLILLSVTMSGCWLLEPENHHGHHEGSREHDHGGERRHK